MELQNPKKRARPDGEMLKSKKRARRTIAETAILNKSSSSSSSLQLPDDIILQIMSYYHDSRPRIDTVAHLFKTFGRVNKQLRKCCTLFCQRTPIQLYNDWHEKYKLIAFICKTKMKISHITVKYIDKNLRASLFLYLLQECDLSQLEYVYIETLSGLEQHSCDIIQTFCIEAGIPNHVFEQEVILRQTCAKNKTGNRLNFLLEELVVDGLSKISKHAENQSLPIRTFEIVTRHHPQQWLNDQNYEQNLLGFIASCHVLEELSLDMLSASTTELFETCYFFQELSRVISKLNITTLSLGSDDYQGEFGIQSTSLQFLEFDMPKCILKQIACPSLKKASISMGTFGESFLSSFGSSSMETFALTLKNFEHEEENTVQSAFLSNLVKQMPTLKTLKLRNDKVVENGPKLRNLLCIESKSIEKLHTLKCGDYLRFTRIDCPKLKELTVQISFRWYDYCQLQLEHSEFERVRKILQE
ncbi:predicted protein [Chaetoceros tenuissimus]|uniref:F-box domain-containing protein n=1 Tax=Chaetoceros tenuissimus TaxID=426638 RepID=A0AAD3CHG4_9STRA|nr:predicted protein [Chaetoceros tenuissimus]